MRRIAVVGIGADGWAGLGEAARAAILGADEVIGTQRQLEMLPVASAKSTRVLPSPVEPLLDELAARADGATCVLAAGDPMLHGIGATLAGRLGPDELDVHPHPSAFALVCARLGWPSAGVELVNTVGRPPDVAARVLQPGRRVVVYAGGEDGAARLARMLRSRGYGPSRFVVFERLGGAGERIVDLTAQVWGGRWAERLHAIAIECRPAHATPLLQRTPGLPDAAYAGDGRPTLHRIRAMTLAALQPMPGQLLWDVGAANGSIAIEWLRAEPTARAIAIEARSDRAKQAATNALGLGVPELEVRKGTAPAALDGLPAPDAVFIGGGLEAPGLVAACWVALNPRGRIVANALTLEAEQALIAARAAYGGELARVEIAQAQPLGGLTGWRAQPPVVQWTASKT